MTEPQVLLSEYVARGSEPAFREVVERYLNLVYGTAVRLVDGDTHRAEDVAQMVFSDLARLAGTLSAQVALGGWLHRRTCHVAASLMRSERRRQNREKEAMSMPPDSSDANFDQLVPVLDEAINQLGAQDRVAITLRFLEGRDLRAVGAALGSTEDAAQKRVARALQKLRGLLGRRGVAASCGALAAILSAQASTAAPAGLAANISAAAVAGAAAGKGGLAFTILKLVSMAEIKIAVGTVVVAVLGTALVLEQQSLTKLREQNGALESRVAQLDKATGLRAAHSQPPASDPNSLPEDQLRAEVAALRRDATDLAGLRAKNHELHLATGEPEDPGEAEFQQETEARMNHLKQWGLFWHMYALDHNEHFPTNFEQTAEMRVEGLQSELEFGTNNFDILYHGRTASGLGPPHVASLLLFRDKQARRSPTGDWVRVYGFIDGHTEAHAEPDEARFAAWEAEHIFAAPPGTEPLSR